MTMEDIGPAPVAFDIEQQTLGNDNYRTVIWSGKFMQVTVMSIPVGEDIGLEVHPDTDQFLRIEQGKGMAKMGDSKDNLDFVKTVEDDDVIIVPAGKWHNVENVGDEELKLYSIYAPAHHKPGKIHKTKADDNEIDDEPAEWSFQPPRTGEDQHA